MFDNYVGAKSQKRRKWVGITIIASVALHVVVICGLLARSFWVLEKLTPPDTTVAIAAAPPPPPPPPAGSKVHHHTNKVHLHKVHAMVQPDKHKKHPPQTDSKDNGVVGGIQGGVTGGVVGGVLGGTVGGTLGGTGSGPPQVKQGPHIVPQVLLEKKRIAGEKNIAPSDPTKTKIKRDGKSIVVTEVMMCLSSHGSIKSLHLRKSSGYPSYDRRILSKMHGWRYRPSRVNGRPIPVCSLVVFRYLQSN